MNSIFAFPALKTRIFNESESLSHYELQLDRWLSRYTTEVLVPE